VPASPVRQRQSGLVVFNFYVDILVSWTEQVLCLFQLFLSMLDVYRLPS
jgi:hypothetical protein